MPCMRCSPEIARVPECGTLYLAPPLAHTLGTLRGLLARAGAACEEPAPGILAIALEPGCLGRLATALGPALSLAELRDTRSLVLEGGGAPGLASLAAMEPLGTLLGRLSGAWLSAMIGEGRLTTHFQPIVSAVAPARVFAHECLLRGVEADGSLVGPSVLYQTARQADLMFPLDRAARMTAIREGVAQGVGADGGRLFINFNPTSIYDPVFCLRSTVAAIAVTDLRPDQIVFEVVESDHMEDLPHLVRIVSYYREAGFRVALDDLGSGFGSLKLLGILRPDFVKLDMDLTRDVDRDPFKAGVVRKLLEMARGLGIATVAEGIETREEWAWMRDHGADYAQGYFFARPGPYRPNTPTWPGGLPDSGAECVTSAASQPG